MPPPPSPAPSSNPQTLHEIVDTIKEYEKMFRKVFTKLLVSQLLKCFLILVVFSSKKRKNTEIYFLKQFWKTFPTHRDKKRGKGVEEKIKHFLGFTTSDGDK